MFVTARQMYKHSAVEEARTGSRRNFALEPQPTIKIKKLPRYVTLLLRHVVQAHRGLSENHHAEGRVAPVLNRYELS